MALCVVVNNGKADVTGVYTGDPLQGCHGVLLDAVEFSQISVSTVSALTEAEIGQLIGAAALVMVTAWIFRALLRFIQNR